MDRRYASPGGSDRTAGGDQTAFLLFNLRWRGEEIGWVQSVQVTPPIDDMRDRAAVMDLLGVDGFLRYLSALVDAEGGGTDDDGDDDDGVFDVIEETPGCRTSRCQDSRT